MLDSRTYPPAGECIYCGARSGLTNEHIVPFGLSGTAVLPQASCRACAAITGRFEQKILRGEFVQVRVHKGLRSRTKHAAAFGEYPLTLIKGTEEETIMVPASEYPIVLSMPDFGPPGIMRKDYGGSGIEIHALHMISFGPKPDDVATRYGADQIRLDTKQSPVAFARMIAKAAYAWAVAEQRVKREDARGVVSSILGKTDDIGRWVGTVERILPRATGLLHQFSMTQLPDPPLPLVGLRLFSASDTPTYGVVLG